MCTNVFIHTHELTKTRTKVNKGQKQQLRQLNMQILNFVCAFYICHCVFCIDMYFIHVYRL